MKAQADNAVSAKSKAVANSASAAVHEAAEAEVLFEDKRPEVVAQQQLAEKADSSPQAGRIAQLQAMANTASVEPVQLQELKGDEDLLEDEPEAEQRVGKEEEIQTKSAVAQKKDEKPANNTGLPDTLKSGIEGLSGLSMDDVKVHYNSAKPAQLQAHAFAQGTDIHMAPGQEKHLPHEAWHVVQQKQGRVKPTKQLKGKVNVNDDAGLEKEADLMGGRASQLKHQDVANNNKISKGSDFLVQRKPDYKLAKGKATTVTAEWKDSEEVNNPKGSEPKEDPLGYSLIRKQGLTKFWIRYHILNHHVGGEGIKRNLVPASQRDNVHYEKNFENTMKQEALSKKNKNMKFAGEVTYRPPKKPQVQGEEPTEHFPSKIVSTWEHNNRQTPLKYTKDFIAPESYEAADQAWKIELMTTSAQWNMVVNDADLAQLLANAVKTYYDRGKILDDSTKSAETIIALEEFLYYSISNYSSDEKVTKLIELWNGEKAGIEGILSAKSGLMISGSIQRDPEFKIGKRESRSRDVKEVNYMEVDSDSESEGDSDYSSQREGRSRSLSPKRSRSRSRSRSRDKEDSDSDSDSDS